MRSAIAAIDSNVLRAVARCISALCASAHASLGQPELGLDFAGRSNSNRGRQPTKGFLKLNCIVCGATCC